MRVKELVREGKDSRKTIDKYQSVDWKDTDEIFEVMDKELKQFNLEVEMLELGDDAYHFRIVERSVVERFAKRRYRND